MRLNLKNSLLAGASVLAVGVYAMPAQAQTVAQTLTGNATWAIDGNQNQSPADGSGARANDPVNIATFTLTVANGGTANDSSGVNTFNVGAVTGTTGSLAITTAAVDADLTANIASVAISGAGNVSVTNLNADNSTVTATVAGALSTGGNLTVTNTETSTGDDVTLTINGATTVTGTTGVSTGAFAGATSNLVVNGNATFTGAVTLTSANAAGANATITINGANTTFTGGLALDHVTAGQAIATVSGTSAQTVAGAITGVTDGDGILNVRNTTTGGATFTGTVGTAANSLALVNVGAAADGSNASATFRNGVDVTAITMGNGTGTDTNTITFDGSTAGYTVAGTLDGTAGDTDNVNVLGGNTIVQSGIWGGTSAIQNLAVSGANTILDSNAAITATNVTIGAGSTLDAAAIITSTGGITNSGTLLLSGAVTHAANITGTGLLDVNAGATVNGAITQGTVDIAAVTLTQSGGTNAYEVGTTNFSGAGTLALAAGNKAVTGNFTNTTDGQGIITIADGAGTTTIVGNLGAGTANSLAALTMGAGATGQSVTTTGNLFVDAITIDATDTLQFLGTTAQTVSGTIAGQSNNEGVLTVGNGTTLSNVTFNGVLGGGGLGLASANVSANATANYNANATVVGAHTNAGNAFVARGTTLTAGSYAGAGTYNIAVQDAGTIGTLEVGDFGRLASGGAIDLAAETVNFNVTGNITAGTIASVFTGGGAAVNALAETDNSFQYGLDLVANGNNFDVVVTRATINSIGLTDQDKAVGTVLDSLDNSTNAQIAAVVDNIAAASSRNAVNEVIESVLPSVDSGAVQAGYTSSVQSLDVTGSRMDTLRTGGSDTGVSSGEMGNGLTAWIKGFGKTAQQDERDGVDGYDADTLGVAVGVDTAGSLSNGTVGVALSYANSDVDADNANATESDIDSWQVSLYGDYDIAPETYLAGTLAFANNSIDQTRYRVGGVSGLTADADYDSKQYIAYLEAGRSIGIAENTVLTPSVLAHYQHINVDGYTETGAGGANLVVDSDDLNIFELGLGAEVAWNLETAEGALVRPALNVGYRHDLIGDEVEASSRFTGGGASFKTQGVDPAQGTFNIGGSVGYTLDNNWEVTADYDYEVKEDYDAHSGYLRAGYKF